MDKHEALFCIHEIVNSVKFPEIRHDQGRRIRFEAENLIPKILDIETGHIFYKEKVAKIAQMLQQGKTIEEIAEIFRKKSPA